jgi:hypothetical protein
MYITYIFSHNLIKILKFNNLWILYLLYNYLLIFYNVLIATNYEKIILKFFVIYIALAVIAILHDNVF